MSLSWDYNGVRLSRSDFGDSLEECIAFSISFAASTRCSNKDVALELLRAEAAAIIDKITKASARPVCGEFHPSDTLICSTCGMYDSEHALPGDERGDDPNDHHSRR